MQPKPRLLPSQQSSSDIRIMADWQEWFSACFISLIFAYMLAKLISVVVSFRTENLRVEREGERDVSPSAPPVRQPTGTVREEHNPAPAEHQGILSMAETSEGPITLSQEKLVFQADSEILSSQKDPKDQGLQAEAVDERRFKEHHKDENLLSDDEEWEGIEGTELDETFGTAASFVEKMALDPSFKISSDLQLRFYGLYKQATEGPCSAPQPPAYKLTARAKWHAWKKLGDISPEEGMQRYITLLSELCPDWIKTTKDHTLAEGSQVQSTGSNNKTGRMGPVFSVPAKEDPSEEDGLVAVQGCQIFKLTSDVLIFSELELLSLSYTIGSLENVHKCAKGGDVKGIKELLESDCSVDQMDSDGRTPLHWAVDQGHIAVVRLLISQGAQINAKDSEGQTALHYAVICQREEIAELLLENGADPSITDNDGCTPYA